MTSAEKIGSASGMMTLPARTQLLARSFLFRGLDAVLLERVARLCQPRREHLVQRRARQRGIFARHAPLQAREPHVVCRPAAHHQARDERA